MRLYYFTHDYGDPELDALLIRRPDLRYIGFAAQLRQSFAESA